MTLLLDSKTGQIKLNSPGYSQLTTTLTAVSQKLSEQKFYTVPFADYLPVVKGQGAYMDSILNWTSFVSGDGFETGLVYNGTNKSRVEQVDSNFDRVDQKIYNWAKGVVYNNFELQQALVVNNAFSLIEARETSRRKQWALGLQKLAFLGIGADAGLLNSSQVTNDTSSLTGRLNELSSADFNSFAGSMVGLYRENSNYTAMPSHFVIPEKDFRGLANFPDAAFPVRTRLEILTEAFKLVTMNPEFKILPLAYCDKAHFDGTNNRYVLLNYDPTSLKMDIPMDLTVTAFATANGFSWESVGMGQFTAPVFIRPKEVYYFSNTAA